jgi:hypothetical protein
LEGVREEFKVFIRIIVVDLFQNFVSLVTTARKLPLLGIDILCFVIRDFDPVKACIFVLIMLLLTMREDKQWSLTALFLLFSATSPISLVLNYIFGHSFVLF